MLFRTVNGFPIRHRFDFNLFNLRRLQAKTRVQTDVLDELLYADDMDKNASSEAKSNGPWINSHSHALTLISQSTKKTEVAHQHAPGKSYNVSTNGQKRRVVDIFNYHGSTLSRVSSAH